MNPNPSRRNTLLHALLFILGFSLVFVIGWGGAATAIGGAFASKRIAIGRIGGVIIILLGLFTMRVLEIPWLNFEWRRYWRPGKGGQVLSSVMMGIFFAAGWTPCIGTTLGAILTLGMSRSSSTQAMVLASGYALGMGIPFLALGIGMEQAVRFFGRVKKFVRPIEIASGFLLVVLGVLLLLDQMSLITIWALRNGLYLDLPLGGTDIPTYAIAVLAGMLSFLSPCVLSLVPAYLGYLSGRVVNDLQER